MLATAHQRAEILACLTHDSHISLEILNLCRQGLLSWPAPEAADTGGSFPPWLAWSRELLLYHVFSDAVAGQPCRFAGFFC